MYIADPWAFDRAIQALAPISMDPNVRLEPNVRLALQEAALGIDKQIDPTGNTHVVREFVEQMPEEWKELGQSGMDAFNGISEAATLMAEGKLDPMTGMNQIMGHINGVMGDFSASIPNPDAGYTPIRDWGANSAIGIADNYNVDIRPIVDNIQQQMQNQAPRGTAEVHQNVNVNVNPLPPQQESYAPPAQQPAHEFGTRIKNLFENLAPQAPAAPTPTPPIPAPTAPVAEQLNIPTTPIHVEVTPPATPAPVVTGPIPAPTFPEVKVGNGQAARDVQTMIENGMDVLNSSLANAR